MGYDAILKDPSMVGEVYYGYIYNDSKGRFADGTFIRTSYIVSVKDVLSELITILTDIHEAMETQ